jgi:hypothetical protein
MERILCSLCKEKRARRECPVKETKICPECCAKYRIEEIRCREDCEYLREANAYRQRKTPTKETLFRMLHQKFLKCYWRAISEVVNKILSLKETHLGKLTDREVKQALELAKEQFQKKIILPNCVPSARVELLSLKIEETLEEAENEETGLPLSTEECQKCIDYLLGLLSDISTLEEGESTFIEKLAQKKAEYVDKRKSIIIEP